MKMKKFFIKLIKMKVRHPLKENKKNVRKRKYWINKIKNKKKEKVFVKLSILSCLSIFQKVE